MEDLIAIEQVARKLWEQTTNGTATEWDVLSSLPSKHGATARGWKSPSGASRWVHPNWWLFYSATKTRVCGAVACG